MMDNLARDTSLNISIRRRETMVTIGQHMLSNGIEPAFVAGMLANVMGEGNFGQFEIAGNPLPNWQSYLTYVVNNHNYRNRFSGQHIYNLGANVLQDVRNIISSRIATQGNNVNIFGLGALQWTNSTRILHLVDNYIVEAGGANNSITRNQVIRAESSTLMQQLSGQGNHISASGADPDFSGIASTTNLPNFWRNRNSSNLNSVTAASDASQIITRTFVRPGNTLTVANDRSREAINIFNVMMR